MTAQVCDREDDFLAFPLPGLSLLGGTCGGDCFQSLPLQTCHTRASKPSYKDNFPDVGFK